MEPLCGGNAEKAERGNGEKTRETMWPRLERSARQAARASARFSAMIVRRRRTTWCVYIRRSSASKPVDTATLVETFYSKVGDLRVYDLSVSFMLLPVVNSR